MAPPSEQCPAHDTARQPVRPSFIAQVQMTDPQKNSTTSAHDKKSVSEQQDEDYDKMQRENTKYTIPRRTPEPVSYTHLTLPTKA